MSMLWLINLTLQNIPPPKKNRALLNPLFLKEGTFAGGLGWPAMIILRKGVTRPFPCWLVVLNISYFHPYLGKWSNLTNIFQMGWNHQLDSPGSFRDLCIKKFHWGGKDLDGDDLGGKSGGKGGWDGNHVGIGSPAPRTRMAVTTRIAMRD